MSQQLGPQSVLVSNPWGEWEQLGDSYALARLHEKFWGKSMAEEEEEWRQSQGNCLVGAGIDDDDDGDIGPGCYTLDIGISGLVCSKLWIRTDYIRIYDFCNTHYETSSGPNARPPLVVITGQPGIGKSFWIYYAIRRRLSERQPFFWFHQKRLYLFVGKGVFKVPEDFHTGAEFLKRLLWTFIDADESKDGIPTQFVTQNTGFFVIFTTPPNQERWSRLHKTTSPVTVIMNPWTEKEIFKAASIYDHVHHELIRNVYHEFGPIPRLCFEYARNALQFKTYKKQLANAIKLTTLDTLNLMASGADDLAMDAASHKIILVSRMERSDLVDSMVAPITPSIKSRLAARLRAEERSRQLTLYKDFASVPSSRRVAGVIYESVAQRILQENIELDLVPMVTLGRRAQGDKLPQWHSSHQPLDNTDLEASRLDVLTKKSSLAFTPSETIEYGNNLSTIGEGVFYVPQSTTQVGFDSFIAINGIFYIFRFTIASNHTINPRTFQFLKRILHLPMDDWRFVFIIPPGSILTCPQLRPDEGLSLFSAELSTDGTKTTAATATRITIRQSASTSTEAAKRPAESDQDSLKRAKQSTQLKPAAPADKTKKGPKKKSSRC